MNASRDDSAGSPTDPSDVSGDFEFDGQYDPDPDHDPLGPPKEPCECWCLHCRRTFMSSEMWFQRVINDPKGFPGFWMCPTPNCGGAGFTIDIFPTDMNHPANAGWHDCDDDEEYFDEEGNPVNAGDWDPDETKYQELDEEYGEEDDDLEGEEWKYGLQPGERPPEPEETEMMRQSRLEWEEEQRRYDMPDERPRVVDWSDRDDRHFDFNEDDIPF